MLFVLSVLLIFFFLIAFLTHIKMMYLMLCIFGVFLFSLFLIYDTQVIYKILILNKKKIVNIVLFY